MRLSGFALRWAGALLLVFITFNPSGFSYGHWIWPLSSEQIPLKILTGLGLLGCYVVYVTATFRSLGAVGVLLVFAFCATLVWLFVDQGWLDWRNAGVMSWVTIMVIGFVMGLGISWSHFKKRLTGQFDTDDVGE